MNNRGTSLIAACAALVLGLPVSSDAQTVLDGAYIKEHTKTQRVVPYPFIREADVMWYRRIWREIDVTEKINQPLYYPLEKINDRKSLFDVIKDGLLVDGSITAYDPGADGWEDEFKRPLLTAEIKELLSRTDSVWVDRLDGTGQDLNVVTVETKSENVKRYRLKEDWIFDKQRSSMDIRIIGLAPLKEKLDQNDGSLRGYSVLFWLYFPELRYVLVNWEVFNRQNDAERRSFDHVFWTRQFNSTIIKESNVYNRVLADVKTGINGVLESESIKQDLFEFEHDLWNF
ncbi:MAG: gliding motility protein GldN [Bacteroidetes bacterium]|jgi:gliding motility associated protien GldN|nr:gliding motility protein GldN [Bacteroidota bacterium]MBX7130513.1 gliding motility protein GldN [Flavobacteriales bacterium]MCC6655062.1 gliding motility protein GldN [Flavobacteriales bacterium]HMU15189.1 gliding motility protein GldN [Flavobacteriales bacterium]HMW96132.1 gliding motility protein GldN [Flavobacteriales bacterium]